MKVVYHPFDILQVIVDALPSYECTLAVGN
jgi:hypothetical protein